MTIKFEDIFESQQVKLVTNNAFDAQLSMASQSSEPVQLKQAGAYVEPMSAPKPILVCFSASCAELLHFQANRHLPEVLELLSGNSQLYGTQPYAMNYGGHQFGHWSGQLGDGRAITLFETMTDTGRFAVQLKGAGPTVFSRRGDGFAVLRSSIREFLCSEAMHALGVPTTRALSLIDRGELVWRDMLYDGRAQQEPSAVVCRVAPSFIRFGHFELLARRGDRERLEQLIEFTLQYYYADSMTDSEQSEERSDAQQGHAKLSSVTTASVNLLFAQICESTAQLLVHWQTLGFTHGVLNTDNMSIHGITLDYGPFGWLEPYDPLWTPNTTDAQGRRYAFGEQPKIALWNLWQLANALATVIDNSKGLSESLSGFQDQFQQYYLAKMKQKLGVEQCSRIQLDWLEHLFEKGQVDMTLFFRELANVSTASDLKLLFKKTSYLSEHCWLIDDVFEQFSKYYIQELQASDLFERRQKMNTINPCYVPRNYLLFEAIQKAEQGDYSMVNELHTVWSQPYLDQGYEKFQQKRPDWAATTPGCSALSCSS